MGRPITTTKGGICFAFPNVCKTPSPGGPVPIPYPSIGKLSDAQGTSPNVNAGTKPVVTTASIIPDTKGDSAGTAGGGVKSNTISLEVEFTAGSASVFANGNAVVRFGDSTKQNKGNAVGVVLGGFPKVLVGG